MSNLETVKNHFKFEQVIKLKWQNQECFWQWPDDCLRHDYLKKNIHTTKCTHGYVYKTNKPVSASFQKLFSHCEVEHKPLPVHEDDIKVFFKNLEIRFTHNG